MLHDEQIVTFTEATKLLPPINGRRPCASTIWRWARKGIQGIRLESMRIGGRYVTSAEALERFAIALAEVGANPDTGPTLRPRPKVRHPHDRQQAIGHAESELRDA